jgi:hypothetical protein
MRRAAAHPQMGTRHRPETSPSNLNLDAVPPEDKTNPTRRKPRSNRILHAQLDRAESEGDSRRRLTKRTRAASTATRTCRRSGRRQTNRRFACVRSPFVSFKSCPWCRTNPPFVFVVKANPSFTRKPLLCIAGVLTAPSHAGPSLTRRPPSSRATSMFRDGKCAVARRAGDSASR